MLGTPSVIFELDSLVVVKLVRLRSSSNRFFDPLLCDIIQLLHSSDWTTKVRHVYREANRGGADL